MDKYMLELAGMMRDAASLLENMAARAMTKSAAIEIVDSILMENVQMSTRLRFALRANNIVSVADLREWCGNHYPKQMAECSQWNVGRKTISELEQLAEQFHIDFLPYGTK